LGRAALHEGLRRLKARGVETALVETGADDEGNIAFYQEAGFRITNRLLAYEKAI
jgi:ribosomal protein S18 acetylase RimI-like enzyme